MTSAEQPPAPDACRQCEGELDAGDDFCRECGHSTSYAGSNDDLFTVTDDDHNSGDICAQCGATHMLTTAGGRRLCESCGFLG